MQQRTGVDDGSNRRGDRSRLTLRQRLRAFVTIGVVLVMLVAGAGWLSVDHMRDRTDEINSLNESKNDLQEFGQAASVVHSNVRQAIFAAQGYLELTEEEAQQVFQLQVGVVTDALTNAQTGELPAAVHDQLRGLTSSLSAFLTEANRLTAVAYRDVQAAASDLVGFEQLTTAVIVAQQEVLDAMDALVLDAQRRGDRIPGKVALISLMLVALTVLLLGGSALVIGRSLRRSLATLGQVAHSIASGDLRARAAVTTDDELGQLAAAVNEMATDLELLVGQLEATAERDGFGSRLSEALEMADTESEAMSTIERAMTTVSSTAPMEILLADSSKARLARSASNPMAGPPCCPVESPFSCVAVRRGNPVVFEDSEALNACPKLRGRASGPISAVCVPVTFMGRALGVLHSTGPVGAPLGTEAIGQLTALATQAGARIGTVRSFERSQLQATTDGLTGLRNRRTAETELRGMLNEGVQLSLVMADLDHFKLLNDTYGHEAGDRALRMFSQVLEASLRDSDIGARFGGEEFVIAMPGTSAATATEVLDRLRDRLAVTAGESGNPAFTASFGVVDSALGGSLEELLRIADAALYRAKDEGRNRVTIADERDVVAATRPGDWTSTSSASSRSATSTTAAGPRSVVGAFQRAAAIDDPMPQGPLRR